MSKIERKKVLMERFQTPDGLKTVGEICAMAADFIEENGWCRGSHTAGTAVCGLAALAKVTGNCNRRFGGMGGVTAAVHEELMEISKTYAKLAQGTAVRASSELTPTDFFVEWNDYPNRSIDHVVGAFRAVRAKEISREPVLA